MPLPTQPNVTQAYADGTVTANVRAEPEKQNRSVLRSLL